MHLYNNIKDQCIDLIVHESYVCLYYGQYVVEIEKQELSKNIKGDMDICVDIEAGTVRYKKPHDIHRTEATFVLTTEDSYTDCEEYGTMTFFYFAITPEVAQYILC